ncbi:HNH endonuclease [Xanthomonas sp. SHU 199]|uniref:HNH endonuclease n=1 Tax=Xanthomonas sp. SHU 199 TaxID=1591174 RepID=UPI000475AA62
MTSKQVKFTWDRVDRRGEDDCWPWIGRLNSWGYGACQLNGRTVNASRAAYLSAHGEIAEGLVVCHRCDNPACCNPAHLFAATQAENIIDCKRKGRWRNRSGPTHPRPGAKLTPDLVRIARQLYVSGVSQSEIGRLWGVHSSTISRAVRGERWGQFT